MSPELAAPLRTKEEAFQDLLASVRRDWQSKAVEPLVARYEASLAGAYNHLTTLEQCEIVLDKQRAEFSRQTRFAAKGLKAPIWAHDTQCECIARIRLVEKRKAAITAHLDNCAGLARIVSGAAA